jgi:hypothetical protein
MKYKISLEFNCNLDTDISEKEVQSFFESNFASINGAFDKKLNIKISKIDKIERIKLGEFSVNDVLSNLSKTKKDYECNGKTYCVKMNSHRYFMFKENRFCVCCGIEGTKMFLECHKADMTPHFNLYGETKDGLVLMTKDHIQARALTGEDRHSNYQTMCSVCNNLKSHTSLTLDSLKSLRVLYDDNKNNLGKKALHVLLEDAKTNLKKSTRDTSQKNKTKESVFANCDINCYIDKGDIFGKFVYDSAAGKKQIGCIKKGTQLEPLVECRNKIVCKLTDTEAISLDKHLVGSKN